MKKEAVIRAFKGFWFIDGTNYPAKPGEKVVFTAQELVDYANENDICITNKYSLIDKYSNQLKN